jgi:AcrR family transcriptional regulator
MAKSVVKSKKSYFHGNLREAILTTSLKLIEKSGIDQLSIREVAKATGVTHQAPYRHFKDREELLAALAQDGFEKLYIDMSKFVEGIIDPMDRAIKIGEGYFQWATSNKEHFRLMFNRNVPDYDTSVGLKAASAKILELVLSVVAENQAAGNIRKVDDTRLVARQFWAAVHGVSLLFIDNQFKPLIEDLNLGQQLIKDIVTNLVNGLRPR